MKFCKNKYPPAPRFAVRVYPTLNGGGCVKKAICILIAVFMLTVTLCGCNTREVLVSEFETANTQAVAIKTTTGATKTTVPSKTSVEIRSESPYACITFSSYDQFREEIQQYDDSRILGEKLKAGSTNNTYNLDVYKQKFDMLLRDKCVYIPILPDGVLARHVQIYGVGVVHFNIQLDNGAETTIKLWLNDIEFEEIPFAEKRELVTRDGIKVQYDYVDVPEKGLKGGYFTGAQGKYHWRMTYSNVDGAPYEELVKNLQFEKVDL